MPITTENILDLKEGQSYVLVDSDNNCQDVTYGGIYDCNEFVFFNLKTGEPVYISGYIDNEYGAQSYCCFSEADLEAGIEFVYDKNSVLVCTIASNWNCLLGKVFSRVYRSDESVLFELHENHRPSDKSKLIEIKHVQECCEHVYLEDVVGDLDDLINTPILDVKEVRSKSEYGTAYFYDFRTIKGSVTLRFQHEENSNLYYSAKASLVWGNFSVVYS